MAVRNLSRSSSLALEAYTYINLHTESAPTRLRTKQAKNSLKLTTRLAMTCACAEETDAPRGRELVFAALDAAGRLSSESNSRAGTEAGAHQ
jgi:hypothetical protein